MLPEELADEFQTALNHAFGAGVVKHIIERDQVVDAIERRDKAWLHRAAQLAEKGYTETTDDIAAAARLADVLLKIDALIGDLVVHE